MRFLSLRFYQILQTYLGEKIKALCFPRMACPDLSKVSILHLKHNIPKPLSPQCYTYAFYKGSWCRSSGTQELQAGCFHWRNLSWFQFLHGVSVNLLFPLQSWYFYLDQKTFAALAVAFLSVSYENCLQIFSFLNKLWKKCQLIFVNCTAKKSIITPLIGANVSNLSYYEIVRLVSRCFYSFHVLNDLILMADHFALCQE